MKGEKKKCDLKRCYWNTIAFRFWLYMSKMASAIFCNGTELRTYERIVAYPATASQLIRVLTNEATLAGVFGNAETVWVATQEPGSDDFKIEKKSAADLDKYDKLPEGVYASSHPERLAKYVEFLTSVDAEK